MCICHPLPRSSSLQLLSIPNSLLSLCKGAQDKVWCARWRRHPTLPASLSACVGSHFSLDASHLPLRWPLLQPVHKRPYSLCREEAKKVPNFTSESVGMRPTSTVKGKQRGQDTLLFLLGRRRPTLSPNPPALGQLQPQRHPTVSLKNHQIYCGAGRIL